MDALYLDGEISPGEKLINPGSPSVSDHGASERIPSIKPDRILFSPFKDKEYYADAHPNTSKAAELFKKLNDDFISGDTNRVAELQNGACGLMIDLDFFFENSKITIHGRHIQDLVKRVSEFIAKRIDIPEFEDIDMVVGVIRRPFDKEYGSDEDVLQYSEKHKYFKDGLHLLFPGFVFTRREKKYIIAGLQESKIISEVFSDCIITNDDKLGEVIDGGSAHVPAFLLGSVKPGRKDHYSLYKHVFKINIEDDGEVSITHKKAISYAKRYNMPLELSLHKWGCEKLNTNKNRTILNDECRAEMQTIEKAAQEAHDKHKVSDAEMEAVNQNKEEYIELVRDVVSSIDTTRSDITGQWVSVLSVLNTLGHLYDCSDDMLSLADEFSKKSTKYVSTEDVQRCMTSAKNKTYMGLLWYYLKKDDSDRFRELYSRWCSKFEQTVSVSDLEYFSDYSKLINKTITYEQARKWLSGCVVIFINGGDSYYITKNKKTYIMDTYSEHTCSYKLVKGVPLHNTLSVDCNVMNPAYIPEESRSQEQKDELKAAKKGKTKWSEQYMATSLSDFAHHCFQKGIIKRYTDLEFFPYLKRNGIPDIGDRFNMFGGFPLEDYKPKSVKDYENSRFRTHLKEHMCGGSAAEFDHFEDWIADIIQKPHRPVACVQHFYGKQGEGKDMQGRFISSLLGEEHCTAYQNEKQFFKDFNMDQANKLYVRINELSEQGASRENHDVFKGMIDRKTIRVEPKGKDAYEVRHCARYTTFTNNERTLHVESSDRRFTMHKCSGKKAGDMTYFAPIWEEVNDRDMQKAAFEFYASRKYKTSNVLKGLETEYKTEQKLANLSNCLTYIKDSFENGFPRAMDLEYDNNKEILKFTYQGIYNSYSTHCESTGCKRYAMKTFKSHLLDVINSKLYKSVKLGGKNKKGYRISKDEIEQGFRDFLKMPDFELSTIDHDTDSDDSDDGDE